LRTGHKKGGEAEGKGFRAVQVNGFARCRELVSEWVITPDRLS
jgi:hypothetical protein